MLASSVALHMQEIYYTPARLAYASNAVKGKKGKR